MQTLTLGLIGAQGEVSRQALSCLGSLPVRVVFEERIGEWPRLLETLERLKPDAVLFDMAGAEEALEDSVRRIRRTAAAPAVIVLHTSADTDTVLRAMRAGAGEFVTPPLESSLKAALDRLSAEKMAEARGERGSGRTVAFLSAKGGCGATTVACHAAVELHRQTRQSVLLADFDLETGTIGFLMKAKTSYSMLDALANVQRLDLSYWKALVSNGWPGVEVIRAPMAGTYRRLAEHERFPHLLRFARQHYDWVVVDLGRGVGVSTLSALEEVESSYLVTTLDVPALHQAKHFARTLRDSGYKSERLHVVLNRVSRRAELTAEEIEKMLGAGVAGVLPEDQETLYDAYAEGKLAGPDSNLGRRLHQLVTRIAGSAAVKQEKKKKAFSLFG